jgi:hypothetical protein
MFFTTQCYGQKVSLVACHRNILFGVNGINTECHHSKIKKEN